MKKLTISKTERVILTLDDEIQRSPESRYDHRLHAILLIVRGNSGQEVARLLGDAPRTVANWACQAFLGSQGDVWDAQWDMFLALAGAMVVLPIFSRIHDRSMTLLPI